MGPLGVTSITLWGQNIYCPEMLQTPEHKPTWRGLGRRHTRASTQQMAPQRVRRPCSRLRTLAGLGTEI